MKVGQLWGFKQLDLNLEFSQIFYILKEEQENSFIVRILHVRNKKFTSYQHQYHYDKLNYFNSDRMILINE